jgi:CubicO group peptidase (beta-lactamase class C family)/D-alanyl-D-alanine dipeptidase
MNLRHSRPILVAALLAALAACFGAGSASLRPHAAPGPTDTGYGEIAERLGKFIEAQRADKGLPAVSIALIDGPATVWSAGFGYADPEKKVAATADTVYRVGSVSKLFTDIGIMQLVEQGQIDLDAPVDRFLPFHPTNPFGQPVTLRMLMSHHGGLVREPPVGNYFEPAQPDLHAAVASLNATTLVYEPGSKTKYSNAGIAVAGAVFEASRQQPFARALKRAVLEPLGMRHSSFARDDVDEGALARGVMWSYDGRTFPAPTFELGIAPAGCMYSTVTDLARFVSWLLAGGGGEGPIKPTTLREMLTPQPGAALDETRGQKRRFGIGFILSDLDGHRLVGHGGAIYGFATTVIALPDDQFGVVVIASKDVANAVTGRIGKLALQMMLARRAGQPLPEPPATRALTPEEVATLAGRYQHYDKQAELAEYEGKLVLSRSDDEMRAQVKAEAVPNGSFIVDDVNDFGLKIARAGDAVVIGNDTYRRVPDPRPEPPPAEMSGLVGDYGWDHDTLYVYEDRGTLHALIEWFFDYRLKRESANVWAFPASGLYDGEKLTFTRDAQGRATQVVAGTVTFKRRVEGPPENEIRNGIFRIKPVKPVEQLRQAALKATPPEEKGPLRKPDMVELVKLDPTIKLDVKYATSDNFLSTPVYTQARAFMERPAAEALVRANQALHKVGYGILVHDAYRPWYVTKIFWDATPPDLHLYVADPAEGSRHNRGCAADITLYSLRTGQAMEMPGVVDEMSNRSNPQYPGGTALQRWRRDLLRHAVEHEGFHVYEAEWWHFDYDGWKEFPILNARFEDLGAPGAKP